ncbi:MAG: hypothetical protein A2066_20695 [Bacteroidetes bacterium GWB2_41_8]|nr:MAG: hypothetical protein A2066_20695 [Bacteroidetes bacterium GWB2_41_8]
MNFYYGLGILISCYIIFLIWLFHERPADLSVKDLRISKRQFVLAGLQWCQQNLGTTKHRYDLKIYYYRNSNFGGKFQSCNKQIIIYIYPDLKLTNLTDTIIHEYVHHLQFSDKSVERDYNKKLAEVGYWENPYEQEARKIASQNRNECLVWILRHNRLC